MKLFGKNKSEGGLMDDIRCDEKEYLVWKWSPSGRPNSSNKENSIRYGSSLRVKDGELAVFVYKQRDGVLQDFILGPHDETIKTANFPILTSIVGVAFGGASPFQAEIYFINLASNNQINFGVPYFDVFDIRSENFPVPVAVTGNLTFKIADYKEFIKLNRLRSFEIEDLKNQIRKTIYKYVKIIVANAPTNNGINVLQIEQKLDLIDDFVKDKLKVKLATIYGIDLRDFNIDAINIDKQSQGYKELMSITGDLEKDTKIAQSSINIKNLHDVQSINKENVEESLRINRDESQRAQRLQTESENISAHQLNQQTEVGKKAAESIGKMGSGGSGGGNMDPGSMMASMAMGGAVGGGLAKSVGDMMGGINSQKQTPPPPPPQSQYHIAINGETKGPFNWKQLQQMVKEGNITRKTHVWKQGMSDWELAENVEEFYSLFGSVPPPPPAP